MSRGRPEKTLADYVAIAVSPLLIMALVGSLAFFLLEVAYSGQYGERLRWILFWFVLASVLVARIAIQHGSGHAAAYGLALGGATTLVIFRFVETFPLAAILLLGVIWWCAHKLTWDCTLIDDSEDASGEGLLQIAGLEREGEAPAEPDAGTAEAARREPRPPGDGDKPLSAWQRIFQNRPEREGKPHAPGLWVVYFSLAALPLFGLGQVLIPSSEVESRTYAFRLLWIYVASGMGLLLTTSFLGLRRYLRQRKLAMPAAMTGTWMLMGAGLIVTILVLCLVLPRPEAEYTFTALVDKVASKAANASRFAPGADDAGEGEGRRAGKPDEGGEKPGEDQQQGRAGKGGQQTGGKGEPAGEGEGKKAGESQQRGQQQGQAGQQEQQAGEGQDQNGEQKDEQEQEKQGAAAGGQAEKKDANRQGHGGRRERGQQGSAGRSQSGSTLSQLSHAGEWIGTLVKWIIYGAIAVAALYLMIRHRAQVAEFLRQLWADLMALFGRREDASGNEARREGEAVVRPQPFAAFANPFSTGLANRMSPEQLVQYTFQALEAWAYEQGEQRSATETPLEFTRRLGDRFPVLAKEARPFARLYAELAYAERFPTPDAIAPTVERLWRRLSAQSQGAGLVAISEET